MRGRLLSPLSSPSPVSDLPARSLPIRQRTYGAFPSLWPFPSHSPTAAFPSFGRKDQRAPSCPSSLVPSTPSPSRQVKRRDLFFPPSSPFLSVLPFPIPDRSRACPFPSFTTLRLRSCLWASFFFIPDPFSARAISSPSSPLTKEFSHQVSGIPSSLLPCYLSPTGPVSFPSPPFLR